jgi:hypothetical protein
MPPNYTLNCIADDTSIATFCGTFSPKKALQQQLIETAYIQI